MGNYDLRVIMIEPLGDGGITHYSFNLINALVHKGVDVFLFTSKNMNLRIKTYHFLCTIECFVLRHMLSKKYLL